MNIHCTTSLYIQLIERGHTKYFIEFSANPVIRHQNIPTQKRHLTNPSLVTRTPCRSTTAPRDSAVGAERTKTRHCGLTHASNAPRFIGLCGLNRILSEPFYFLLVSSLLEVLPFCSASAVFASVFAS